MGFLRKAFTAGLAGLFVISGTLPVFADTILVPRLGYTTSASKRIYVDITTPEEAKAETKERRTQEKLSRKEQRELEKAREKEARELEKLRKEQQRQARKKQNDDLEASDTPDSQRFETPQPEARGEDTPEQIDLRINHFRPSVPGNLLAFNHIDGLLVANNTTDVPNGGTLWVWGEEIEIVPADDDDLVETTPSSSQSQPALSAPPAATQQPVMAQPVKEAPQPQVQVQKQSVSPATTTTAEPRQTQTAPSQQPKAQPRVAAPQVTQPPATVATPKATRKEKKAKALKPDKAALKKQKEEAKAQSPKELAKAEKRRLAEIQAEEKRLAKKEKEEAKWVAIEEKRRLKYENMSPTEKAKLAEKEAARKRAKVERDSKFKARMEALEVKKNQVAVDGSYFLYNLKQERLFYKENSKLQPAPNTAKAPFFIEFKEELAEGVYDIAVKGSGHRSVQPLWVSDSIYWDALHPVLQDVSKTHCPQQTGHYRIIQQCYRLEVLTDTSKLDDPQSLPLLVQGGWYNEGYLQDGPVKETRNITNIAQMLMHVHNVNPKAFNYLPLFGDNYALSRYPDVLDEVLWGVQYLLTIQQPAGGIPAGVEKVTVNNRHVYKLMPVSDESTARGVMVLATAVKAFKQEDLSQAVKFMRAAEKGWRYLQQSGRQVDPELLLLASSALMLVSDNPEYAQAYDQAKSQLTSISQETALLLPASLSGDFAVHRTEGPVSKQFSSALPLILQLRQKNNSTFDSLAQWVTDLFGYEEITLTRDPKFEMVSAFQDPLQWAASKTGEVATRFGQRISDAGIYRNEAEVTSQQLKKLEESEQAARKRVKTGYGELQLTTLEKAYLAYALALLNHHVDPTENPNKRLEPQRHYYEEPPSTNPKGFFPKLI